MLKYILIPLLLLAFSPNSNAQDSTSYNLKGLVTKTTADRFGFQICQAIKDTNRIDSIVQSPSRIIPLVHDTVIAHLELADPKEWGFDPTLCREAFIQLNNGLNYYSGVRMVGAKLQYEGEQYYTNYGFGILFGEIKLRYFDKKDPGDIEDILIEFLAFQIGNRFFMIEMDF